jgi:hypothetical protein
VECENPRHKEHLKRFLKKYPTASKDATYDIIDVDPPIHWVANLDHEARNMAKSCQMCSIQEDIERCSSPGTNQLRDIGVYCGATLNLTIVGLVSLGEI